MPLRTNLEPKSETKRLEFALRCRLPHTLERCVPKSWRKQPLKVLGESGANEQESRGKCSTERVLVSAFSLGRASLGVGCGFFVLTAQGANAGAWHCLRCSGSHIAHQERSFSGFIRSTALFCVAPWAHPAVVFSAVCKRDMRCMHSNISFP